LASYFAVFKLRHLGGRPPEPKGGGVLQVHRRLDPVGELHLPEVRPLVKRFDHWSKDLTTGRKTWPRPLVAGGHGSDILVSMYRYRVKSKSTGHGSKRMVKWSNGQMVKWSNGQMVK
jgi:hypothetical protein